MTTADLAAKRDRIGAAMLEVVARDGYVETEIEAVLELAGVDRADFDALFDGKEQCFLHFYGEMTERFTKTIFDAFEAEESWRDGLRAAAYAAAEWLQVHPRETKYGTTEILAAGAFAHGYRDSMLKCLYELIDRGRFELDDPDSVSPAVAQGVLGSIVEMLIRNLRSGERTRPDQLVPELMYLAVRPYFGHAAAQEELSARPARK